MTTLTATAARKNFFDLVKGAAEDHQVFRIQHRHGMAVMMSETDYDEIKETVELLSIPGFRESIARSKKQMDKGDTVSMKDVFGE